MDICKLPFQISFTMNVKVYSLSESSSEERGGVSRAH